MFWVVPTTLMFAFCERGISMLAPVALAIVVPPLTAVMLHEYVPLSPAPVALRYTFELTHESLDASFVMVMLGLS